MIVDANLRGRSLGEVGAEAAALERDGYAGVWTSETDRDPFLPLVAAAQHTERVELGTAIAVAFARNPMSVAYLANDLQCYSGGRFVLGLGSQVRPHVERRFGMPWSRPAARMREFVQALRTIWSCWQTGDRLAFRGEFYSHTLMPPFFAPPPHDLGAPKVYLAAVGDVMTGVAGEVADGILTHPFTTERYLRERTLPIVERSLAGGGRSRADFAVSYNGFVATGADDDALRRAVAATRERIAFYGSTPSYRPVLELHGWGELSEELNRLSRSGDPDRWQRMGELITDDVLHAFAVVGEPSEIVGELLRRYGDTVDRITFYTPYETEPTLWAPLVAELNAYRRPRATGP